MFSKLMKCMRNKIILGTFVAIFLIANTNFSQAAGQYSPLSSNDYIFGYTSSKFSCWSGTFTNSNAPHLEIYDQSNWIDVSAGVVVSNPSLLDGTCSVEFPVAIGYTWTVMNPNPPAATNRYTALYRQKVPDQIVITTKQVLKEVPKVSLKTKTVNVSKKVPYIATVTVNGKKTNVIKYKTVKVPTKQTYYETTTTTAYFDEEVRNTVPGYVSTNGNISIYSSISAMNSYVADVGSSVLCSFGFKDHCKK